MRILLVDSDVARLAAIRGHLLAELEGVSVDTAVAGATAARMIDDTEYDADDPGYDVVVSADEVGEIDGLALLEQVDGRYDRDVPFVMIVGSDRGRSAIEAFGKGADRILRRGDDTDARHRYLARAIVEEARRNDVRPRYRESEEQIRDVLADSEEAILLIDDGTFVDCNDAAAEMLGYDDPEAIVGSHPSAFSPPTQPDGEPSEEKAERVMELGAQGGYHRFEWLHRRADGEDVLLDVSLTPIIYEGERMLYCVWRAAGDGSAGEGRAADLTVDAPIADAAVSRGTEIRALVVDGDGRRGSVLAHDVERIADGIEVTVVTTANEAIFALDSSEEFDCLLVTTGVADVDPVQLIDQVRENRPLFPTLLVTETPDQELVSRAVEAGASDYVVRHPDGGNPTAIAEKIRATVEQSRLQRDVESSVQRYRTLSEHLPDPTAFLRDGAVGFCNERFVELTGRDRQPLRDDTFVETVVHPDDRERFDRALEAWASDTSGSEDAGVRMTEIRLVQPDGAVRQCEVAGRPVDTDGLSGMLLSFRDVTDRERRERELELERALIGTIPDALVESQTRATFEAAALETLHDKDYDLVCIGEPMEGVLSQRVVRGDRGYVDAVDWSIDDGTDGTEPCLWAARAGSPQYVRDVEDLFPAAWRDAALAAGYRSGAGIPLEYRGVTYGVLGVYVDAAGRFDERERAVLERFADAVAFAIHAIEVENALTADAVSEVTVTVGPAGYYLPELAREGAFVDTGDVRVRGTVPRDGEVIQYVSVRGGSLPAVREAIESHSAVTDVTVIDESDPARLQVTTTGPVPEARLAAGGAVVTDTRIDPSGATITLELPVAADPRSVAERLEAEFGSVEITASFDGDRESRPGPADRFRDANLTEKQATVLEAAYHHGYFERPRQHSATEVAESLGIAHSTFLQHLRAAEKKVFRQRFE